MANIESFKEKLASNLSSGLSAKEIAERIVMVALEAEYGRSFILKQTRSGFTASRGFAKMVDTIAEAIVTNPELRRQALLLARFYTENRDHQKNIR